MTDFVSPLLEFINQEVAELGTRGFSNALLLASGKVDKLVKSLEKLDQTRRVSPQILASINSKIRREVTEIEKAAANGITDALKARSILAGKLASKHLQIELARFSEIFDAKLLRTRLTISGSAIQSITIGQKFGQQVVKDLKRSLSIAVPKKETVGQLVERLKKRNLSKVYRSNADRLLSTEINKEYNLLKLEGIKALNRQTPGYLKMWNAVIDRRTCRHCERMDGAVAQPDGNFPQGHFVPPVHPRCRCCIVVWRRSWIFKS